MQIKLLDENEFIKKHDCKEIDNAIMFNFGSQPTETGLFSYEIFGITGSDARKETFAYIDLHGKFLHPIAYKILTTMNRNLIQCINGTKYFSLNAKGEIVEDSENGSTGISFLYDNWEKIKWKTTDSSSRDDKIKVLRSNPKDVIFIDKFLVMPPFLRDFKPTEANERVDAVDEINDMYGKLIRSCQNNDEFSLGFLAHNNNFIIQTTLNDIYNYCTRQLASKTGLIHQALLGKSVDYATRSVISCPRVTSNTWQTTQVRFGYTGIPLAQCISLFYPFFVYEIQVWFETNLDSINDTLKEKNIPVKNFMENFDEEHIKKLMNSFIKNHESRFKPLTFKDDNGNEIELKLYENDLKRKFTLTDLFYIVAQDVVQTKHVYVTRYPITGFMSIYPSRVKVLSTQKTTKQKLGSKYFEEYPLILDDYPLKASNSGEEEIFVDTTRINSAYLIGLNGDFDGDTVSIRAVYSQEANAEAEEIINSKNYIIDTSGNTPRRLKNEAVQAIYSLTY